MPTFFNDGRHAPQRNLPLLMSCSVYKAKGATPPDVTHWDLAPRPGVRPGSRTAVAAINWTRALGREVEQYAHASL